MFKIHRKLAYTRTFFGFRKLAYGGFRIGLGFGFFESCGSGDLWGIFIPRPDAIKGKPAF